MAADFLSLSDVAQHTDVLVIGCTRCDRAGRYQLDTLIARYGLAFGVPALLRPLSADCPKRESVSAYDLCGVHCPDLPALIRKG
jgi:hypothetical protein